MKTEEQFGLEVIIIEENIDESIFEISEVNPEIIEKMKNQLKSTGEKQ